MHLLGRVISHRYGCCIDAGEGAAATAAVWKWRLAGERAGMPANELRRRARPADQA
jgi:hypothetical protein